MEIVIKIPNKDYSVILTEIMLACHGCKIIELPKGHGRLIDADALEKKMCDRGDREEVFGDDRAMWESSAVSVALDMFAPTIIEADKESEE